jgi:hypothetical protein
VAVSQGVGAQWGPMGRDPGGAVMYQSNMELGSRRASEVGVLAWQGYSYLMASLCPVGPEGQRSQHCMDLVQDWGPAWTEGWRAWWRGAMALLAYGAWTCQASCSFIRLWHGEAFHDLMVYSAIFLALLGALSQPSGSPASQQSPWITELTWSVVVSQ